MIFFLVLHVLQGNVVGQRAVGDDHRRGVRADVAGQALDLHGQRQELADLGVGVVQLLQLVALRQGRLDGDLQFVGHHGHHGVDPRDGHAQGPAHVADGRPRRQRAEGADLGHVLHAVLFLDVLDHLAAALLAEVDVDIGRLPPALVQEPLEQQIVGQRADVAQIQGVGHQRTDARSAGRGRNVLRTGEAHEVPHDEEVVGKPQLVDHAQLAVHAGHDLFRQFAVDDPLGIAGVSLFQAGKDQLMEKILRGRSIGRAVDGEVPLAQLQVDVYAVGDLLRPLDGLAVAAEDRVHLLGAAKIELVGLHPHAVGVGAELARVDAEQDVLGLGVFAEHVVYVAGGYQGQAHAVGQVDGAFHGDALLFDAVVLDLDEVAVAENLVVPGGRFAGLFHAGRPAHQQPAVQLAGDAAAQADQALAVGGQDLLVDAGTEVKTFQKGPGRELQEVLKAGAVLGQDGDVVAGFLGAAGVFLVEAAGGGDVGLDAHDGVDAHVLGRLVELQGPVQIAVVGEGQGIHAQLFGPLEQAGDLSGAVEKAVVAMAM